MPAHVTDIHGEQQTVLTAGDAWDTMKWWVSGFGAAFFILLATALIKANDMQHAIAETRGMIVAQDTAIGGHATARLQLQALKQTMDQVGGDISEIKSGVQSIVRGSRRP